MIRSHPPPQAGCPLGDPGPLAVLTHSVDSLEHNHLAAKIKRHYEIFEEAVPDVHLKLLLIVAGARQPERSLSRIDCQSSESHRLENARLALIRTVIADKLFSLGVAHLFFQAESCNGFRSKGKGSARSRVNGRFHFLSVHEDRVDQHAFVVTEWDGDRIYRVRRVQNARIGRLGVKPYLRLRIIDLDYAIAEKAVTEHALNWPFHLGGELCQIDCPC